MSGVAVRRRQRACIAALWCTLAGGGAGTGRLAAQLTPAVDHHQHLFSPATVELLAGSGVPVITAADLVAMLDSARIGRAAVLSVAYLYGSPSRAVTNEHEKVVAENDWTSREVARYPDRLVGFCSFNPLKKYALDELARCARDPYLNTGIKLHLGNSDVRLDDPAHVTKLREVFSAANARGMAIVIHLRSNFGRGAPYGPAQAKIFIEQLLPAAPDVVVQVAHVAGTGPGYGDAAADSAMGVLADAVSRGDPRTRKLWFDVSGIVHPQMTRAAAARLVHRIRQAGVVRMLYGSDAATPGNLRPRDSWATFQRLPLTSAELARIARNVAPYLHRPAP